MGQGRTHWREHGKAGGGRIPCSQTKSTGHSLLAKPTTDSSLQLPDRDLSAHLTTSSNPSLSPPGSRPSSPTSLCSCGPCPVLPELYTPHKAPCPNANFCSHLLCLDPPPATQKYNSLYREPGRRVGGEARTGKDHPRASGGNRSTGRGSQKGVRCLP